MKSSKDKTTKKQDESAKRPNDWSVTERLQLLMEKTHGLADETLNAYCRGKGIFPHHLRQWRSAFESGTSPTNPVEVRELKEKNKALQATRPNQLYSWDNTELPTAIKGMFFSLYVFLDIYSRKIVGWQVYEHENSEWAAEIVRDIAQREGIDLDQVTLHSDNGGPMRGATMLATLQKLVIMPSFSRPSVSNDNPYSEALFKTLKYRPE